MNKLTEKQKKILNIVVTSLQIVVIVLAITLSAIVLANPNIANAEIGDNKTKLLPVLTNSMDGDKPDSFKEGDLVIAKVPKDADALEVGDIITFKTTKDGVQVLNTHRIVKKDVVQGEVFFKTKGDAPGLDEDILPVPANEVLAVYSSHWKNVGGMIFWLQQPTNFFLVIVLPLVLLFVYNIILFVRMLMLAKLKQAEEDKAVGVDEEAIKQKAIEEYLASKEKEEKAAEEKAEKEIEKSDKDKEEVNEPPVKD